MRIGANIKHNIAFVIIAVIVPYAITDMMNNSIQPTVINNIIFNALPITRKCNTGPGNLTLTAE
jgi:hypothetical protein